MRFQRCILQSFDTPRFRNDDREWLRRRNGEPLETLLSHKLALARAEALLNLGFGREIVVPAGQIADSQGFEDVFMSVNAAYFPRMDKIDRAFESAGLPRWRPFRVALEDRTMENYQGFLDRYEYTGAPMTLLEINGESIDREMATKALFETAISHFRDGDFEALGALMEQATGRIGFSEFSRDVAAYFSLAVPVYADENAPRIGTAEYAGLFRSRLERVDPDTLGLADAKETLEPVKQIEHDLAQHGLTGLRGNWYVYRKAFGENWPLARAYLDFRLFVNLSRLFDVDHPIFVSQAFEAERYGHSLILGPKFDVRDEVIPERDLRLAGFTGRVAERINWDGLFELFCEPQFIASLKAMTVAATGGPGSGPGYAMAIRAHGSLLADKASDVFRVDVASGRIGAAGAETASQQILHAIEPAMAKDSTSDEAAEMHRSTMFGLHDIGNAYAHASIAPLDETGAFNLGLEAADAMLNYIVKPYRDVVLLGR